MPERIGRYAVHRRIGSGAFATVWLAYDEHLDSPVAIKLLADNWTADAHVRARFVEEGRYLRRVESPHVVTVHDAGELDDGRPYLVMTYADQGTLAERIGGSDGLTTAQSLTVIAHLGRGLQALHERDVLHRDVKPGNVLFRSFGNGSDTRAMLGDLGLGKALDISSRLTLIGGTPAFVAPEQAAGERLDARADQYSLATIAYLLLAGRPPFGHASLQAAAAPGPIPPMSTAERTVATEIEAVLRRGLAPAKGERYPDVAAFADALGAAAMRSGEAPAVTRPGQPWLPLREQSTLPGRATAAGTTGPTPAAEPAPRPEPGSTRERPRRGGWRPAAAAGLLLLLAGAAGVAGYGLAHGRPARTGSVVLTDASGQISVRVPAAWDRYRSLSRWVPPDQPEGATARYPALWTGSTSDWNSSAVRAEGVFIGVLPSTRLPGSLPEHPGCQAHREILGKDLQGRDQTTVHYTGCPGGIVIEQVTKLRGGRLLWVQVHSASISGGDAVLLSVATRGL